MTGISVLLRSSGLVRRDDHNNIDAEGARLLYLSAGHLYAASEPSHVTTILGSCVAVCLWDPRTRAGGLNHFMLPQDVGVNCGTPRYAAFAIRTLIEEMVALGAPPSRLQAKLFGGACVLASFAASGRDLGAKNVA